MPVLGASLASARAASCSYERAMSSIIFFETGSSNWSATKRAASARCRQCDGSSGSNGVCMHGEPQELPLGSIERLRLSARYRF
jgi:hypothetical protein